MKILNMNWTKLEQYFRAYPGSINLRVEPYSNPVRDVLGGLLEQGFKRITPMASLQRERTITVAREYRPKALWNA